ncbi:MAG: alpha/beta fold hydrolase [Solirubrobacterales bacterium]
MSVLFEHRLRIAGYETRALELDGSGPPLILLHGWSDSADTWRGLLDLLRREGRRAVALDMPGYGTASPLEPGGPVLPQLDRFLRGALVRFAGSEPALIAGNSLGGSAVLRVAADPPGPLAGAIPIAPAGLDMAGWFGVVEGERLIRALLASPVPLPEPIVRAAVGQVYRQVAFARPRAVDRRVVSSFTQHLSSRSDVARVLASGRRLLPELADPFELGRIACPVLLVWGERDRMVFPSGAARVLREVGGARFEVIPGCGHCPQLEATGRLAELIVGFEGLGEARRYHSATIKSG